MANINPSLPNNKLTNPNSTMSDVPECYNFGVYFDDGYNYGKHVKSLKEFVSDPAFEQLEEIRLPDDYIPPEVKPVSPPLDPDFDIISDDEYIEEAGELEDNFVELAGGKHVPMDEDIDDEEEKKEVELATRKVPSLQASSNMLPIHKVKMMERFLFGIESTGEEGSMLEEFRKEQQCAPAPSTTVASMRKGRVLTDQEELLEKQFENLMHKTKSRAGIDGRSIVSGTSVMSENLQSVVTADQDVSAHRHPKGDHISVIDATAKAAVLQAVEEMPEENNGDPLQAWLGPGKPTFDTITNKLSMPNDVKQPSILQVPRKSRHSRSAGNESVSDSDNGISDECSARPPIPTVRMPGETAEEKKMRKNVLKTYKKERKQMRKVNKAIFRTEVLQAKANGQVRIVRID